MAEHARTAEATGELDRALELYSAAAAAAAEDPAQLTLLLRAMARIHNLHGDYVLGLDAARHSLAAAERTGQAREIVAALNAVAVSMQLRGRLADAERVYLRAAELAERSGETLLLPAIRQNLASLAGMRRDPGAALGR